ncbi:restriction endonuclease subunit S [Ectobacillus antri]|uniref:Restriction endonuclease subunit S n=1 Tax=Ectobacillus antri TaxID=2486280 RepID=A0ABT6H9T4_9BACI|nr:restriction endonuclease subunit S [Ectobacillus antri]MDG4658204.1 restriction endonuclease subunit S [Ectobacillus antri]MDG5755276.1 restriction endonuclease subunit S [Ectobacillus antri]
MSFEVWENKKLRDLTTKIGSGSTPKGGSKSYKKNGIPFIRSQNIYNCEFSPAGLVYIDNEQAKKLSNVELEEGDILLNITGDSVARCTEVPKQFIGGRVNQHVALIRVDKTQLSSKFLKYHLVSPRMQGFMLSLAQMGGTRAALTKGMIESFEISLPCLIEQQAIANILSSLDEKIEINNQINKKLEEMAQAIFKQWFVDFEFSNEEGKPYKSSGGKMVESELGMIPDGWGIGRLNEVANLSSESVNPQKHPDRVFEHFSIPALDNNKKPEMQVGLEIKSNKYVISEKVVLISKLNPITKRIWRPFPQGKHPICSTEFMVYVPKISSTLPFVYELINSNAFNEMLISHATGSTGSRQRVKPSQTLEFKFPLPSMELINKFSETIEPLHVNASLKLIENQKLILIRDTLLPKLMSGEIRVPVE